MTALDRLRRIIERILEIWVVFLVSALTVIVVLAVIWRKAGASFVWYDEVGSIMLAWITYYGAALAALKRAHIGFDGILLALPWRWRIAAAILGEIVVFAFFIVLAWTGMQVLQVLQGMSLISLPGVPIAVHAVGHPDRRDAVHHLRGAQPAGILAPAARRHFRRRGGGRASRCTRRKEAAT